MKTEVLAAIGNLGLTLSDFDIQFEGDIHCSDRIVKEIETDNYSIDLEVVVLCRYLDYQDFELKDIDIDVFIVYDSEGEELDTDDITDEEIINALDI